MTLDLKSLITQSEGAFANFSFKIASSDNISLKDDKEIISDIQGNVLFRRTKEGVLGDFDIKGKVKLLCDRCLREFEKEIETKFEQEFILFNIIPKNNYYLDLKNEGFVINDKFEVKLNETLRQGILISLPMKKICKEKCQGIQYKKIKN